MSLHENLLLKVLFYHMDQHLRSIVMREVPQAYNEYVGGEILSVFRNADGTPVLESRTHITETLSEAEAKIQALKNALCEAFPHAFDVAKPAPPPQFSSRQSAENAGARWKAAVQLADIILEAYGEYVSPGEANTPDDT